MDTADVFQKFYYLDYEYRRHLISTLTRVDGRGCQLLDHRNIQTIRVNDDPESNK